MLCIVMLVEILVAPTGVAEDVLLSGFTSSQGLAFSLIGVHDSCDSAVPRNLHSTCALSTRLMGNLQNLARPPVKRGLVQLRTPSLNVNVVLIAPGTFEIENGWLSMLRLVDK